MGDAIRNNSTISSETSSRPSGLDDVPLAEEWATFQRRLSEWLASGLAGRFAVIKGSHVLAICRTLVEAMIAGRDRFGSDQFLVQEIQPHVRPLFIRHPRSMSRLTFPFTLDGLQVDVLIGVDSGTASTLAAAGQAIPRPIQGRAIIDTGTTRTVVLPRLLTRSGIQPWGSAQTITGGGPITVNQFLISLTVFDVGGLSQDTFFRGAWPVTDLPYNLPDVDVLLGLDFIHEVVLQHRRAQFAVYI